jgi:hypothetical protein
MDGQMPFEEWIYGTPPEEVDFVRINGNRVIRVEIAKDGEPVQVFTKDVVSAMLRTDGTPVLTAQSNTRTIREGDVAIDPDKQEAAPPPSLRNPGEQLPTGSQSAGEMRPVQMPKPHNDDDQLGANPDEQQAPANGQAAPANGQPSNTTSQPAASQSSPSNAQPPASNGSQKPAPSNTQAPPPGSSQYVTTSSTAEPAPSNAAQSN